jgi:hypothetical protein
LWRLERVAVLCFVGVTLGFNFDGVAIRAFWRLGAGGLGLDSEERAGRFRCNREARCSPPLRVLRRACSLSRLAWSVGVRIGGDASGGAVGGVVAAAGGTDDDWARLRISLMVTHLDFWDLYGAELPGGKTAATAGEARLARGRSRMLRPPVQRRGSRTRERR